MKRLHLFAGAALAAWMTIVPAGFAAAQGGGMGGAGGGGGSAGSAGGVGATTGVGGGVGGRFGGGAGPGGFAGGVGGRFGGAPGRTYGSIVGGVPNLNGVNLQNAGAADRFRGQGIDRSGDGRNANMTAAQAAAAARANALFNNAGRTNANRTTSNRPNFTQNQTAGQADANQSNREATNDNDTFQSDPYQSATTSGQAMSQREQWLAQRHRAAEDQRRFQRQRYNDSSSSSQNNTTYVPVPYYAGDYYGTGYGYANGEYAGPVHDVPVDPLASGYVYPTPGHQGPASVWTARRIERSIAQHQPSRTQAQNGNSQYSDSYYGDVNGVPPRDRSRRSLGPARTQSLDRAANYVNANRGREPEVFADELPPDEAVRAARETDQRLDPRGR